VATPSLVWVLEPSVPAERAEALRAGLAAGGADATLHGIPGGRALLLRDPPTGLVRPPEVVREATIAGAAACGRRALLDRFALAAALGTLGATGALGALYATPRRGFSREPDEVDAGPAAAVPPGGSLPFLFGSEPCLLLADGDGFRAVAATCTHLGCLVHRAPGSDRLDCPCHRGSFDLAGNVVAGPPPRSLRPFDVLRRGDRLVVRRRTES
jgi:nitrite reductase/ring-hydroxylating ferredoxin subunit